MRNASQGELRTGKFVGEVCVSMFLDYVAIFGLFGLILGGGGFLDVLIAYVPFMRAILCFSSEMEVG